jgi:hypothetical protein
MTGFYVYNGGGFSSKPNGNVVIGEPSGNGKNNNIPKNNPSPLDTSHFKVNSNITNTDTSNEKTFDIEEPRIYSQVQKQEHIIVDVPIKIKTKTPKTPAKTRTKPTKSKETSTNFSDLAGNTPKTNRMPSSTSDSIEIEQTPEAFPVPNRIEKSYKVRIKLQGDMKEAEILVNGEKPLSVKKNVWGTPQYVEFKSFSEKQTFTFTHNGISCKVENVVILTDEVTIEACRLMKK